ncbi:MAG: long-chain-fatty-acid--CoA ligase [Candidatus Nezhaarchaeota archaeon]|nr:long-chain-fatty-acid--CoA ligase [Candidatus Nezhaarchaeota archaeon]
MRGDEGFVRVGYRYQLTLTHLLEDSVKLYPRQEVVYRDRARYSYAELYDRCRRLSSALESIGVKQGLRVGTLEWNTHRHLEAYFAVPCMGAILHPINPYLPPEQLVYVINHAEDVVLLLNKEFIPLCEKISDRLRSVRAFVVMSDDEAPETRLEPAYEYEELLRSSSKYEYPELDEEQVATLCYTSGTTGLPKGCFFTHRALSLHTLVWAACLPKVGVNVVSDAIMHLVPMYHVHSWGFPYIGFFHGLKHLLPGRFDPKVVLEMLRRERRPGQRVFTACVAAVARRIFHHPEAELYRECFKDLIVNIGGGPLPEGLARRMEELGAFFFSGWGMTEAAPVMGMCMPKPHMLDWPEEEKLRFRLKTGWAPPFSEQRVVDEEGRDVEPDGRHPGEIVYRSPWASPGYYKDPEKSRELWRGGWMHTGDIATIDEERCVHIVDRAKDLIKSGGEWISSIKLEALISTHPGVFEVAVVGVPHEKWEERPVALVVPIQGVELTEEGLRRHLMKSVEEGVIPKWWIPDAFVIVEEIPKTGTGKFDKKVIRERLKDLLAKKNEPAP